MATLSISAPFVLRDSSGLNFSLFVWSRFVSCEVVGLLGVNWDREGYRQTERMGRLASSEIMSLFDGSGACGVPATVGELAEQLQLALGASRSVQFVGRDGQWKVNLYFDEVH